MMPSNVDATTPSSAQVTVLWVQVAGSGVKSLLPISTLF
jgi:hypothetical protein